MRVFRRSKSNDWKAMLAGASGGVLASAAKVTAERAFPPRTAGQVPPPVLALRKLLGRPMNSRTERLAMAGIHYGFGAAVGAAYGTLVEHKPRAATGRGALFGLGLDALTHNLTLPLLGLSAAPWKQSRRELSSEVVTHMIFGVVTEAARAFVRREMA